MARMTLQQAFDLALAHHRAGRLADAEPIYRQILAHAPNHANALHHLGILASQSGHGDASAALIRRAIALRPKWPQACCNLGKALYDDGRLNEAAQAYGQAIALLPDDPEARTQRGVALMELGQLDAAIADFRQAVAIRPDFSEAWVGLGAALARAGSLDDALAACRRAVTLRPDAFDAHYNLANILKDKMLYGEAIAAYLRAIELKPNLPEAHNNLGVVLRDKGDPDASIAAFRQAIAARPDYADSHHNLALMLLLRGNFVEGWAEYEWRLRAFAVPRFEQPQWDGSRLADGTILLHAEQGFGDAIQVVRYAEQVAGRVGNVLLQCPAELTRLLAGARGIAQVIPAGQPLPRFDVHCPLMSLPGIFQTTFSTIPADVPYLVPDRQLVESWSQRLGKGCGRFRVGLAWAGRPTFNGDYARSLHLSALAPLARVPGVTFFSLQKGPAAEQASSPPDGMELIKLGEDLRDFADTAAVMSLMDLIISTDTSVPHLAGALGRPAWVMLQFVPDWRWLLGREDSPWYPTMRVFRQQSVGDWDSVIRRVAEALNSLARLV